MSTPAEVNLRIDRLVVETAHPVDGFAFQQALSTALQAVVEERGWPAGPDRWTPLLVLNDFAWDGRGGEPALARALAERLYEGVLR